MKKTDEPVIVEQTFDASIGAVWSALTELDQMRQWYFENIPAFKPEVGFETQFDVKNEGRIFPHIWKVTEVVPHKLLKYGWRFEGYPGDSFVVFELSEENDMTRLTLTVHVLEDFPDEIPEFRRESCVAGWDYFIRQSLKNFLAKNK